MTITTETYELLMDSCQSIVLGIGQGVLMVLVLGLHPSVTSRKTWLSLPFGQHL